MQTNHPIFTALALAALAGCTHRVAPVPGSLPLGVVETQDTPADQDHAETLARAKLQADGVTLISFQLHAGSLPGNYAFDAYYSQPELGLVCYYSAKGAVQVATGHVTLQRTVQACFQPQPVPTGVAAGT